MSSGHESPAPRSGAAEGEPTLAVIDWAEALARMDGDAEMLREICAIFQGDAPGIRARLVAATAAGDLVALQFVAHNLRGASATVSAAEVAALAGQLEQSAGAGALAESRALAAAALTAFDRLLLALEHADAAHRRSA